MNIFSEKPFHSTLLASAFFLSSFLSGSVIAAPFTVSYVTSAIKNPNFYPGLHPNYFDYWEELPGFSSIKDSNANVAHGGAWFAFAVDTYQSGAFTQPGYVTYNNVASEPYKVYGVTAPSGEVFLRSVYYNIGATRYHDFYTIATDDRTATLHVK